MGQEQLLSYQFGFVMEQNLGHRTHYRNLLRYVRTDPTVAATWLPIEFETDTWHGRVPGISQNWTARASLQAWSAVRGAMKSTPLDGVFYHTQVTALLAQFHPKLPAIISLDATPINYDSVGTFYGHRTGGLSEKAKFAANRRAFDHAEALVTWCQWAKDSLIHDYRIEKERISVIPPGVDLSQWPRHTGYDRVRASSERLPRLLFVGGDFERKGGNILLESFHKALRGRCELSIVTQSPVTPAPDIHVYKNVTPNSDTLLRLYADADIFVFPTLADCAPLAVPEAMAASLPVVTTHVGAISEMVRHGREGYLLRPGDVDALTESLEHLLAEPDTRARMGDAARLRAEAEHDAQRNAHRLLGVLKSATDATHRLPEVRWEDSIVAVESPD